METKTQRPEITLGRAIELYQRRCEERGYVPEQPSNESEQLANGTWRLHNVNGLLAHVSEGGSVFFPGD